MLEEAAEAGNASAMCSYGAVYYSGLGVQQDMDKAAYWYEKAAALGSRKAMSNLGYVHYYGRGSHPVDMEKAYRYFSKAALLGDVCALYKCGDMYLKGLYVEADEKAAFSLYCCAFKLVSEEKPLDTYPDICRRLATCLHRGQGAEVDLQAALNLMEQAVRGFELRIGGGDVFTDGVLESARKELQEIEGELAYARILTEEEPQD